MVAAGAVQKEYIGLEAPYDVLEERAHAESQQTG
jgi:hypothetical protein